MVTLTTMVTPMTMVIHMTTAILMVMSYLMVIRTTTATGMVILTKNWLILDCSPKGILQKNNRDFKRRAYTIGIGGPVGSGKTALLLSLCLFLRDKYKLGVVTNDIFTKEDGEFLIKHNALPTEQIVAVETGGCPHAAIREDIGANLVALEQLNQRLQPDLLLIESGGDNLAANFSRELADYIIYVIDVAGGDKIPRKGGPGITQSDMLVINKTDLAQAVGADLVLMEKQAHDMRQGGLVVMSQVKHNIGIPAIAEAILSDWKKATR
eukprot:TRINITY_DN1449_c0_g1_i1.p1 TRINITY_DN1449_c0_g1~~TRINITY_DN1449_c0_g1_i1.p1  ORF type:complete len:267 (-),score=62.57 TRINITY_DN1449_c0_g1_i1:73-873(-)